MKADRSVQVVVLALAMTSLLLLWASALQAGTATYYFSDAPAGPGLWSLLSPNGSPSTDNSTALMVEGVPANEYLIFQPGASNSGNLSALPSSFSGFAWRSPALNGVVPAGNWVLHLKFENPGFFLASVAGSPWVRLWRSTQADGSGATAVTAWLQGSALSISGGATDTDTINASVGSATTLVNEHLFVELAWRVSALSNENNASVLLIVDEASGEDLVLPALSTFTPTSTRTPTPVVTATPSATASPVVSVSSTITPSPVVSATSTITPSPTRSPSPAPGTGPGGSSPEPGAFRTDRNLFDPRVGSLNIHGRSAGERVELAVHNVAGQRVRSLLAGQQAAGPWTCAWDGKDDGGRQAGSDIYLLVLHQPSGDGVLKVVLLRE